MTSTAIWASRSADMIRCFTRQFFIAVAFMAWLLACAGLALAQTVTPAQVRSFLDEKTYLPITAVMVILGVCWGGWRAYIDLRDKTRDVAESVKLLTQSFVSHGGNEDVHRPLESLQKGFVTSGMCDEHHKSLGEKLDGLQKAVEANSEAGLRSTEAVSQAAIAASKAAGAVAENLHILMDRKL